jgi:general secretion pathway protein A
LRLSRRRLPGKRRKRMYRQFFGLNKRPFVLSPDPEFFFLSRGHDLAFTHLEYGLVQNAGFVALTGEVGTGKTTLLKYLFQSVRTSLDIAMILNTQVDPLTLLQMLVREFELDCAAGGKSDLLEVLFDFFSRQYSRGNRCVIVVDEAQNLPLDSFEELRMLSNFEVGNDFLVQIILVGQPQLRERLSHRSLAQLAQRISVHYHLAPLSADEVGDYIQHRLKVAGYLRPGRLFQEAAVTLMTQACGGIPRVINTVCDAALTYAFADELEQIGTDVVDKVLRDNALLVVASWNGEPETATGWPPSTDLPQKNAFSSLPDDLQHVLSGIHDQLGKLEMRLRELELSRMDSAAKALQEVLTEERKQTIRFSQEIVSLSRKCKDVLCDLEQIQRQQEEVKASNGSRKRWRLFCGEKN